MKLSKEFIRSLIAEQLAEVPPPEDQKKEMSEMLKTRMEQLDQIQSTITGMGEYFQGIYPDFDSDLSEIAASIGELVEKIDNKMGELDNEQP
jgi:activator of 2-hydroxyglutaryl-CoA dehydratase